MLYIKIKDILRNGPNVLSLVDLDYSLKFGLVHLPKSIKEFKYVVLIICDLNVILSLFQFILFYFI